MKRRNSRASPGPSAPAVPSHVALLAHAQGALHEGLEVRDSPIHGKGLFATQPIASGTLLGVYEGDCAHENSVYVLWVEYDDGEVVGIDGKNDLRFVNHSRTPNSMHCAICPRVVKSPSTTAKTGPMSTDVSPLAGLRASWCRGRLRARRRAMPVLTLTVRCFVATCPEPFEYT